MSTSNDYQDADLVMLHNNIAAQNDEETTEEDIEYYGDQYPGFIIVCKSCGSSDIQIENWLGSSQDSGAWGNIELRCDNCDNECVLGGFGS